MNIHFEVSYKIGDCIDYTFNGTNPSDCLHDIAHTLPLNFDNEVIHSKEFVRLRYRREF
jgi:hypothetical protein